MNDDRKWYEVLLPLFWWSREPAIATGAIASAVAATINYLAVIGHTISNELMGLGVAWIMVASVVIRSQVTPVHMESE